MLAIAVIVFREVLEAALIISVVMAAAVGLAGRGRWVATGVGIGLAGAALTAAFAAAITNSLSGNGQEVLNAAILGVAVVMLAWHTIWMARHGREMAAQARGITAQISDGSRHMRSLAVIVAAAVLREGAETVLFIAGLAASAEESTMALALGALLGLLGGAAVGGALYAGLLRIPVGRLFSVTGWLVLLLAAGLAAQAAGFLIQADLLPSLGDQLWDTSPLLSEDGMIGRVLHTLIGYVARPAGLQVFAYVTTLVAIGMPMIALRQSRRPQALT